ncbi:uncharacterized protein LOC135098371 [Scylla paramamosain]|uniref:uncharacterized protein LOC135098371 n=1 Tax=Scylla paramamosain TaxID=85552 RepID=UPI003083C0EA
MLLRVSESHTGATPHAPRRAPQGTPGSSSSSSHGVSPHGGASGSPGEGGTDPARQQEGLGASHGSSEPGEADPPWPLLAQAILSDGVVREGHGEEVRETLRTS